MILVLGGTTEGKQVSSVLAGAGYPFWYSTKTEIAVDLPPNARYRHGALTPGALTGFCQQEGIPLLINAAHPFAQLLHQTNPRAALLTAIPCLPPQREYQARLLHPLLF